VWERREREKMRTLLLTVVMVVALVLPATAAERAVPLADRIVVDRSTRSQILNDYVLLTRDAIQRAWTTPVTIEAAGALKGRVTVNYVVSRAGALVDVELTQGSGNDEMDSTLVDAIRRAAPFAPFPEGIAARQMLIRARFVVAEPPAGTVTTVDMNVAPRPAAEEGSDESGTKKYKWGFPAGTARPTLLGPEPGERPVTPPSRRYRWGLEP
jgi:TonB family protein